MSDSDEERNVSQPGTSKQRRPPQSKKKRRSKSNQTELDKTEEEEVVRIYGTTDDKLEQCAQNHNMTALNVKSVIRSVLKDHSLVARVLGTNVDDASGDGLRNTRSRTKAVQNNVDMSSGIRIKQYTFVDLPFNDDDEYDQDYRPDEEDGSDSSRELSSDDDESENLSGIDGDERHGDEDEGLQDETIEEECARERKSKGDGQPNVSRPQSRVRNAMNLTLNEMNGGYDEPSIVYHEFVHAINNEDITYDEEEDPDYTVPPDDLFPEENDHERSYWNTISKREVNLLIEDIIPPDKLAELAQLSNLSPTFPPSKVARSDDAVEPSEWITPKSTPVVNEEEKKPEKSVTQHHIKQIRIQLEQHLQLLTQAYVGCYFEPLLQNEREQAFDMIESLVKLSNSSLYLPSSTFHSINLMPAIETCNGMKDKTLDVPLVALKMEELTIPRGILQSTKEVLSSSTALLYPHLVSRHRMMQSIGNSGWSNSECILFAMALNRYADQPEKVEKTPRNSKYTQIALNSMPWRTPNDLRWQYNGMKRGLKRNGETRHNEQFFKVVEGSRNFNPRRVCRVLPGWTMEEWPVHVHPQWYLLFKVKEKNEKVRITKEEGAKEKEVKTESRKRRREMRIEEGDDEMEPIVIVENEDEEEEEDVDVESIEEEKKIRGPANEHKEDAVSPRSPVDGGEKENKRRKEDNEEIEKTRGSSDGGRGDGEMSEGGGVGPTDFSHLMDEMASSGLRQNTPSRGGLRSTTPNEKTMLPPTPGKRYPSPTEDSIAWFEHMQMHPAASSPPMNSSSPLLHSRIKTPGGTWDYVDSLMGYFGTPEREVDEEKEREDGPSTSKKSTAYSNLFGDFDFEESDTNEEASNSPEKRRIRVKKEMETETESVVEDRGEKRDDETMGSEQVKRRKKRQTREEKERIGMEAISDSSFRRRIMNSLAAKTAKDIISRMNMHSSVLKQIQNIIGGRVEREDKEKMFRQLLPILSSDHKEVLYLLSVFAPPSSLPRPLILSPARHAYIAAMDIMCTIYAYMSTIQRRISYRQLLKTIVEAYTKGGIDGVTCTLKEVLVNDPVLLKALLEYTSPSFPPINSPLWEVIDLRRGDEAFNIFKENPSMERVDECELMGPVLTKRQLMTMGKTPSALLPNNDGEPCLRRKDGKYSEIIVESEEQIEEERKSRQIEMEEEKKAKKKEKTKERMKIVKKAKMAERREEKKEKKKVEEEKKAEDEEKRRTVDEPSLPFTRDVDRALLLMYNEVQRVTKRAARKLAVDLPYSTNFSVEQLQGRLDFLVALANQE